MHLYSYTLGLKYDCTCVYSKIFTEGILLYPGTHDNKVPLKGFHQHFSNLQTLLFMAREASPVEHHQNVCFFPNYTVPLMHVIYEFQIYQNKAVTSAFTRAVGPTVHMVTGILTSTVLI